jgi:hypothetical protein
LRKEILLQQENKKTAYVWSGYREPYVKNLVSGSMKVLTMLAMLTFDAELLIWTKGLQKHLEKRIAEAAKEEAELKKKRF